MKSRIILLAVIVTSFYLGINTQAFAEDSAEVNKNVAFLYQECKADTDMCSFHITGLRIGFLIGSMKAYSMAGGYILGRYGKEEAYSNGEQHISNKGRQILGCYATISVENIKSDFIHRVEQGISASLDYEVLMNQILSDLFSDCAYSETP